MSNDASHGRSHAGRRVVFFGRRCRLSAEPLRALLEAGIDVAAVVIPARSLPGRPPPPIRSVSPRPAHSRLLLADPGEYRSVDDLAQETQIPLLEVSDVRLPEVADLLRTLSPAVFAVSCFPSRLPGTLLRLPERAALNAHPSLLPRHRGPDPLFWTYRGLDPQAGVSIHRMTARLDAGDVVLQQPIELPVGLSGDVLEARCAATAGQLLVAAVDDALHGSACARPQNPHQALYERWPESRHLRLDPNWSAEQAYHFVRGVTPLGYRPTVAIDGREHTVREVAGPGDVFQPSNRLEEHVVTVPWGDEQLTLRIGPATTDLD